MRNEVIWKKNSFTGVFRCTTMKYARSLLKRGEIKFNTPQSWVDWASTNGQGRGDKFEGVIAMCSLYDPENFVKLYNKYKNYNGWRCDIIGNRQFFRICTSMNLPCYCLYALRHEMFDCPKKEGIVELKTTIPGSYFRDFAENLTKEEVGRLPDDEKPAIVMISDFYEFSRRVNMALNNIGLAENDILYRLVDYFDFEKYGPDGWWDMGKTPPEEISTKSDKFIHQNELRIILKTYNTDILKYLEKNTIKIGAIDDIAIIVDKYLHEGMLIEMNVLVHKV